MSAPTRESVYREYASSVDPDGEVSGIQVDKMADEIVRLRTLADDEKAVDRAAKEILHHASFPTLTRWDLIGSSGQRKYLIAARAALRAALGGAP